MIAYITFENENGVLQQLIRPMAFLYCQLIPNGMTI